jgi:hypothetical protein
MAWDYSPFEKSEVKARLAAVLFALTWAVLPGFGLIDLSVTVKPGEFRGVVPVDAGWGLLTTVLLAGAFAWSAVRPRHFAVAAVQLVVVAVALVVSSIAGSESGAFVLAAFVLIEVSVLATLLPRVTDVGFSISVSWPLAATAAIGAGPWLAYAGDMWAANREGRAPEEITIAINHWAVQGGLALASLRWPTEAPNNGIWRAVRGHERAARQTHSPTRGRPGRSARPVAQSRISEARPGGEWGRSRATTS